MAETSQISSQSEAERDRFVVLGEKFFVRLEGKTNGAHQDIVKRLQAVGHTEVKSLEESDYLLVFCPIVSRVGSDISEALEKIPDNKPTILVVMHHTFDPDRVIAESRRLVDKTNVTTVDCLFYENKFLMCERNENARSHIKNLFDHPNDQMC